jgi:hypothetical protein
MCAGSLRNRATFCAPLQKGVFGPQFATWFKVLMASRRTRWRCSLPLGFWGLGGAKSTCHSCVIYNQFLPPPPSSSSL